MYFDYCHQILYKSIIPFSFCQKVQLAAAILTCFLCALTVVFYVNAQHFSINGIRWYFISWTYRADFYWTCCEGKLFVLPEHAIATSFYHSFNIWTFLHVSTRQCHGSPCSQKRLNCCRPRLRTSSGCSTGHQTARISIRLTTRSGHFAWASISLPDSWHQPFERTTDLWMASLWSAYLDSAVGQWWQRLRICIREKGGHFEH